MYINDTGGVNIGPTVAQSQGNLTLDIIGTGNVTQIGGTPILLDNTLTPGVNPATLSVITSNGYVDLSTQPHDEIDAFGTITVSDTTAASGYFLYNSVSGGQPTEQINALQLLDPISATGNVSLNVGPTNNILQTVNAPINATNGSAGSITFSFYNGTFNAQIGNSASTMNGNTATAPPADITNQPYYTSRDAVAFYNYNNLTLNAGANVLARDSVTSISAPTSPLTAPPASRPRRPASPSRARLS
jgi:hypothetical protein